MWSSYRLGYLGVASLVMAGVVYVSAAAEHGSARSALSMSALMSALQSTIEGTEPGNLTEAGAKELTKEIDYLAALAVSRTEPVFIFKHSTSCSISGGAYRRTAAWLEELGDGAPPLFSVRVIEHRTVSDLVAKQTKVAHESPQAILLKSGRAVWSTSHDDITAESLSAALDEHRDDSKNDDDASGAPH